MCDRQNNALWTSNDRFIHRLYSHWPKRQKTIVCYAVKSVSFIWRNYPTPTNHTGNSESIKRILIMGGCTSHQASLLWAGWAWILGHVKKKRPEVLAEPGATHGGVRWGVAWGGVGDERLPTASQSPAPGLNFISHQLSADARANDVAQLW